MCLGPAGHVPGPPEPGGKRGIWAVINIPSCTPPDPTEKVHQCWQDDELFGYQFLNGANPMLLRRSACLPSRLVLPPGMEALRAQLERELQVLPPSLLFPVLPVLCFFLITPTLSKSLASKWKGRCWIEREAMRTKKWEKKG